MSKTIIKRVISPIKEQIQPDTLVEVRSFSGSKLVCSAIVICFLPPGTQRISGGYYLKSPSYKVRVFIPGNDSFITFVNPECLYDFGTDDLIRDDPDGITYRRGMRYFDEELYNYELVQSLYKMNTVRCSCCGKISTENDFVVYQYNSRSHIHIGKCKDCFKI